MCNSNRISVLTFGLCVVWTVACSAGDVSFVRDVVPVLTKAGCNAGTCHGSFQGRGGFRLSLLGDDPAADYVAISRQGRGRRVILAAPGQSLILRKPSGKTPHGGGRVLPEHSEALRILAAWIEQGIPGPDDLTVESLELSTDSLPLKTGEAEEIRIAALWSDGSRTNATPWTLFDSSDLEIADVNRVGRVEALRPGRTAITVRFGGQVAAVRVSVPFDATVPPLEFASRNRVDVLAVEAWSELGVRPARLCDDATFLRRVSLDLTGTLPQPDTIREFVASTSPWKRTTVIDELLGSEDFVTWQKLRWSDLLRAHRRFLGEKGLASFRTWLEQRLRDNSSVATMVRELITSRGNLYTNGPVAFYFVDRTPQDLAETTAQVFLGVRLQCAKCHHHPFEKWSQTDYFRLAAFFAKVQRKDSKESGQFGGVQAVLLDEQARLPHPVTQEPVVPAVPGGSLVDVDAASDPRSHLAAWVTGPDNPYFARNIVNRCWGWLFARGLVHPIDDLRETNPATFPAILDELAADFVAHDYDMRHLLRTICNSRVYQLDAELRPERDEDARLLTHHRPRRLPAEVLLDAICHATGSVEQFPELPPGIRAVALPDSDVKSEFLDIFGRPERNTTCVCDRTSETDLRQALHLVNSELLQQKIAAPDGRIAKLMSGNVANDVIVDELYLVTLGRFPNDGERATVTRYLDRSPSRQEAFEDILWALLNSSEFSFTR